MNRDLEMYVDLVSIMLDVIDALKRIPVHENEALTCLVIHHLLYGDDPKQGPKDSIPEWVHRTYEEVTADERLQRL